MQRKFLSNLFFLLIINLMVKPFWILGIDRAVQNHLGYDAYGQYFALLNLSFILNIFLDVGLTNYNNKNVAQSRAMFHKYLGTMLRLKFMLGGVYAVLTFILALVLGYESQVFAIIAVLTLNQFLISFILFLRSNLSGLFMFKLDSIVSVLDRILLILFVGFLLIYEKGQHLTVMSFVWAQTLAYLLVVIFLLFTLLKVRHRSREKIRRTFSLVMVKQSLPYALLILLMVLYTKVDAVMLERLLPNGSYFSGIYAQSYRLLEALNMIAFLFSTLLLPTFSKMIKDGQSVQSITLSSTKLLGVFAFGSALFSILFTNVLIQGMYPNATELSFQAFPVLIVCIIPISGTYIYGTLLTAAGKMKRLNLMATGGLVLNLILNFILIPKYQVMGAVWATFATQLLTFLAQMVLGKQMFKLLDSLKAYGILLLICTTVYAAFHFLFIGLSLPLQFLLCMALFLALCLGFKQLDVKYLLEMLRNREQAP